MSSGEVTRKEALEALKKPTADSKMITEDREYVIKKLGITEEEFEEIMTRSPKTILDYTNIHSLEMRFRRLLNKMRSMKLLPN